MAHNSNRRVRQSKHVLSVPNGAWSSPEPVLDLEKSGILVAVRIQITNTSQGVAQYGQRCPIAQHEQHQHQIA